MFTDMDVIEVENKSQQRSNSVSDVSEDGRRTPSPSRAFQSLLKKGNSEKKSTKEESKVMMETEHTQEKKEKEPEYIQKENKKETEYTQKDEKIQSGRKSKRNPEEDENGGDKKKYKSKDEGKLEVYVTCKEKFPKQFALAKLFKDLGIVDIVKIKYVSPYKIRVEFDNIDCMDKMMLCNDLIGKGWIFHRAFAVSYTYGIIRDVDMDLTDEDIKKNIKCDAPAVLSSVFRLKRRDASGNWVPSESVRLCFTGTFLPTHVYVDRLRIKVDSYVFPVTQCSRCWKLGHSQSRCSSDKTICPKCGGKHANCDTKTFVCVNCRGNHISLSRACPVYLKEKKIRELMAEFNVTYRMACNMYVPSSPSQMTQPKNSFIQPAPTPPAKPVGVSTFNSFSPLLEESGERKTPYAEVLRVQADIHPTRTNKLHQKRPESNTADSPHVRRTAREANPPPRQVREANPPRRPAREVNSPANLDSDSYDEYDESGRRVTFTELLNRLKDIIFMKHSSFQVKTRLVLQSCLEWLFLVVVDNISDWPILKLLLDYLDG
ncbi:hypothetical protein NE865_06706 [Phthorimaea operculella]|nr:hypothetical protein NE865_06706 [Phthorimaea operculella]